MNGVNAGNVLFACMYKVGEGPQLPVVIACGASSCTTTSTPPDSAYISGISATSMDDIFVTGIAKDGAGAVWHYSPKRPPWTSTEEPKFSGYGTVFSPWAGAVVAAGGYSPDGPGQLALTIEDAINPTPTTVSLDKKAWNAGSIWMSTMTDGSRVLHVLTVAAGTFPAGHYTAPILH